MNGQQKEVARNILIAVGVVGILSAVMIAPGLTKVLPLLSKINVKRINQEIKRLHKRGLVEIIKRKNGVTTIRLTKDGKEKSKRYQIDNLKIEKPIKWDGKWRIIIFDIPVKKDHSRVVLRSKMRNLGFYMLQRSVFVHPYPCHEVVIFLRDFLDISNEVQYIETAHLENQDKLIELFFT